MASLVAMFRVYTGREVVDKSGLTGFYRVSMNVDRGARRGPDSAAPPDAPPSIFTAVQEQLGLKLESRTGPVEVLVIDSLERPTPD
jgi:uncharacterized protein (TIGR03435 family)